LGIFDGDFAVNMVNESCAALIGDALADNWGKTLSKAVSYLLWGQVAARVTFLLSNAREFFIINLSFLLTEAIKGIAGSN